MRIMKAFMLLAISLLLSVSVSASGVGYKDNTEPNIVISTGFQEIAELAAIATDNDAPFRGVSIESLNILKPEKQKKLSKFTCIVQKPTKLAVMQNQNSDRIIS